MRKILNLIGGLLVLTGVAMAVFGVAMSCYQGNDLKPWMSELGMYCFGWWLPTIIAGGLLIALKKRPDKIKIKRAKAVS